ncbi:hypothetical protein NQ318_018691 [Aromia moschata]|uniref:Uncharacterized protein n=1 Tax=Aromia moschata TaxID=1265417 RepID=A0AAV8ZGX6_9CUCU|nr:hypothetical protein NQ318_018691 [Aromia moschata]
MTDSLKSLAAFVVIFAATASTIVAFPERILQGPSSRTTLVGPGRSYISSVSPCGQVNTNENSYADYAPSGAAYSAYSAPYASSGVGEQSSVVSGPSGTISSGKSYSDPGYSAPGDTVVAGPSGTISTRQSG